MLPTHPCHYMPPSNLPHTISNGRVCWQTEMPLKQNISNVQRNAIYINMLNWLSIQDPTFINWVHYLICPESCVWFCEILLVKSGPLKDRLLELNWIHKDCKLIFCFD